ncbi:MAG: pitrilysin family protein [Bdellovibrionota bacterium]
MRRSGRFQKSLLDNGMTLLTESVTQFQSLSIGVWVTAGTRHEKPGEEGLSHFLEHMMFKGTERRSALDIALAVDRVGGEFNAFTAREYTCFHLLLLSRDLNLAVDIMSDVLLSSKLAQEEIERERKVILQEISMVEDNPEELVHDLFFEQAFGGHPLGKPILGSPQTVSSFDRPTVYSYYRRHYSPSQMLISVVGDVDHQRVKKLLNKHLTLKSKEAPRQQHKRANLHRPSIKGSSKTYARDLEQTHVVIGFPGVAYNHADRFSAYLLNVYLGGGMSSSLFQEIREKRGLAYTVYSSLAPFSDTGLFSIYVGTSPKEVGTCMDVIGKELRKLRDATLDKDAVDVLKQNLKSTILLNADSVESRMSAIARNEMFFGRYYSMQDVVRKIDKVTPQSMRAIAKQTFKPGKLVVALMGPKNLKSLPRKLAQHL